MSAVPGALAVTLAATCVVCTLWVLGDHMRKWLKERERERRALDAETDAIIRRGIRKQERQQVNGLNLLHLHDDVFMDVDSGHIVELDADGCLVKRLVCP